MCILRLTFFHTRHQSDVKEKTALQMHVAPQIAVHCCQYAPDVVPDMPQMMLLPTADMIQRLPLDGAVIGTFEFCPVCSV